MITSHPLSIRALRAGGVLCLAFISGCAYDPAGTEPIVRHEPTPTPTVTPPPQETPNSAPTRSEPFTVTLRYAETSGTQQIVAADNLVITTPHQGLKRLPGGNWRLVHKATSAAVIHFPVYVKAFEHHETGALAEEKKLWQANGYTPFVTTLGRAVTGPQGEHYDSRKYWLGIRHCRTEAEAESLKKSLQGQKVWAWTREEIQKPADGTLSFVDGTGNAILTSPFPVRVRSTGPIALEDVRGRKGPLTIPAPLSLSLTRGGALAVDGELPLEYYLEGILPAEMYPDWPLEALKAQAVAARSEVIAHAAGKHYADGFDFCIEQHCRAFAGEDGRHARTDQAVRETEGLVLTSRDKAIVPTVFSANCGGWTENNENVWDGEPAAELRGRSDRSGSSASGANASVESFVATKPASNCAHDSQYYRWSRSLPADKLSAQLNAQYGIGTLQRVESLERGVSGRLKAVRIVGSRKSEIIRKELNIRRAFDNLPSALCTIAVDRKGNAVRIQGAGRGHGVGLCQQGACGMAQANQGYDAILRHYFTGVEISRI